MTTKAYQRHLTRARGALQDAVGEILGQVPGELSRLPALDPLLRQARAEAAEALRRYPAPCLSGFGDALGKLVDETQAGDRPRILDLDSLSIMDDQRIQEEVEVVQAGRMLADEVADPLHRLQRLEATLQAQLNMRDASPVNPAAIGRALWRATERLPLSLVARSEAVRCAMHLLGPRLGRLYLGLIDAAERGESIGVLPEDASEPSIKSVIDGRAAISEPARPRLRMNRRAISDAWAPAQDAQPIDVTRPGRLVGPLCEQQLEHVLTQPLPLEGDGRKVPDLIHRNRAELARLEAAVPSAAVHRLIGRIFDELVTDPELDPEGATWIGRLQPAILRLAADDAELLCNHRHPAWLVVNQLATLFNDNVRARPSNLVLWLERVISKLHSAPRRDRFESINRKLLSWRGEQARRRLTEMEPAVELLRRHALLEKGVEAARQRLARRLDASRADEAVRRYVSSIWALVCAQEAESGAPSGLTQIDAWDTATDLIWSTSPARSRLDLSTLVSMIPALVERLKAGMESLDIETSVQQAWLERIAMLHLSAAHRTPEEAQTDMPLTIDLTLEDELPPGDALPSAPLASVAPDVPGDDPIAALQLGDRLAIRLQGIWTEVEFVWRSDSSHFLLFARSDGGTLSFTRRSLHRLLSEGLARLPDVRSALARAARRIAEHES